MALKVKAKEKLQKIGKYADSYRYVMMPELYSTLPPRVTLLPSPAWEPCASACVPKAVRLSTR